jgi:tol-pal system protein YbgF
MDKLHPYTSGVLIAAFIAAIGAPLFVSAATSPVVVESRELSSVPYQPPVEEDAVPAGIESQYQFQLLQEEVMQLRGLVEQLQFELQRMKSLQDERYLELDSRLQQALQSRPPATETIVTESPEDPGISLTEDLSEKDLYETTQLLIRNRQYDHAISQLEGLIERFPEGDYTPNAYYWLGQVYAAKTSPDFEKARQALAQVISYFPDHSKVPDAAFALGKVYHTLGDCARAEQLLNQVVNQYPDKSAAKLAENYLRESVSCDP